MEHLSGDCKSSYIYLLIAEILFRTANGTDSSQSMEKLWTDLQGMSEALVYAETGCKATCERREWKSKLVYDKTVPMDTNSTELELMLFFTNGHYQVKKEYYKYTYDDLIADSGGLLGLFLGHSILSCFDFLYQTFLKHVKKQEK